MKCPKCQTDNRDAAQYCTKCGQSLKTELITSKGEQSMKNPDLINVGVASFVIGVIGSVIGGFFSNSLQLITDASVFFNDFGFAVPGIVSGFLLCFLGSILFLSMMWNRGDKAIHRVGLLFGAVAGVLSAFISIILIDSLVRPGWASGEDADLGSSLLSCFLFSIPSGAVIGVIAAKIITSFPGKILLRYVNGQPLKPAKSDSAPTEKK
jgi:hypothetical protein